MTKQFNLCLPVLCAAGVLFLASCATPGSGVMRAKQDQQFEKRALQLCEEKGFDPISAQFANCVKDTKWHLLICHDTEVRSIMGAGFAADELLATAQTLLPSEKCKK